jgi:hypothetical protein
MNPHQLMRLPLMIILVCITLLLGDAIYSANNKEYCREVRVELKEAVKRGDLTRSQASQILGRCHKSND